MDLFDEITAITCDPSVTPEERQSRLADLLEATMATAPCTLNGFVAVLEYWNETMFNVLAMYGVQHVATAKTETVH